MLDESLQRWQHHVNTIPGMLSAIPEDVFSLKPAPQKWSKKEILGHLIDSATNNHQRFVRAQFEETPHIVYNQNAWNTHSRHNEIDSAVLISFWKMYNEFLLQMMKRMPDDAFKKGCSTGGAEPVSVEWLIADYVKHMEHHLQQIVG